MLVVSRLSGSLSGDGDSEFRGGLLKSLSGLGEGTLLQGVLCGDLALEERVSVGEDASVRSNLSSHVSKIGSASGKWVNYARACGGELTLTLKSALSISMP